MELISWSIIDHIRDGKRHGDAVTFIVPRTIMDEERSAAPMKYVSEARRAPSISLPGEPPPLDNRNYQWGN